MIKKIGNKILFPYNTKPESSNELWICPYEKKSIIETDSAMLDLWLFLKENLRIVQDIAVIVKNIIDGNNNALYTWFSGYERKLSLYEKMKIIGNNAKSSGWIKDFWKTCKSFNLGFRVFS